MVTVSILFTNTWFGQSSVRKACLFPLGAGRNSWTEGSYSHPKPPHFNVWYWCRQWAGIWAGARTPTCGLSKWLGHPHNMGAGSKRQASQERESQAEAGILHGLTSNIMQDHFCHVLFIRLSKRANPYLRGEEPGFLFWQAAHSKICRDGGAWVA